jgi:DnaJ family protein C protein 3
MWHLHRLLSSIPLFLLSFDFQFEGKLGPMHSKSVTSLSAMLIVAWSTLMRGVECAGEDAEKHLELGNRMLATGQLADALTHYHAAIDLDTTNYKIYHRRATVYLAMGKSKAALPDLDRVLELKPDFHSARLQRGNVKLKQGKVDDAHVDFEQVLSKDPDNDDAKTNLEQIEPLKYNIEHSRALYDDGHYPEAIDILSGVLEICPWDPALRELRAECYINQGDLFKAVSDLRPTTKLRPDNTAGYYKISLLQYDMGEADESLTDIRECLKLDPDHKECFPHYKKVKKLVKHMQSVATFISEEKYDECVSKAEAMLKTENKVFTYIHRANGHICHCHSKAGNFKKALAACKKVLDRDENNIEALCDRAEAYILQDMFQEAVDDYKRAQEVNNDIKRVQDGLNRAERLLKKTQKRDYYKLLGVKKNANKREIVKAYRKLAAEWHPDRHPEGKKRDAAQAKFIDIAAAKEVLTDKDKRATFDNGGDPLDPEEQAQGGGGGPWHQGFNPFGQGGFQFKFNFN